ncbi:MAG: hypothetical protein J0L70_27195 [Leptolyngbya sp. UWPOB_LEPTO1]|uniref:hypothetical protein n=1 Tax=Leptolyngbya sp. UWPOB_LEPTO1 TaxID=2815653 RepID=UPI001AC29DE0|nr:hypothetical protein [Leptolyngbya sp. UWPOB_LEPTO1]MBN8564224.1 hypothetical protein [Leptolyngbya sp. UWPOB_LEPTO1]
MKRMIGASQLVCALTVGLLSTTFIASENRSASAQTAQAAQCYAQFQGRMMYLLNGSFESCVRAIRGAAGGNQLGVGNWGGYAVNTDANGNTYVNSGNGQWQYVGVVRNVSGTVGSLQDRCVRGDVQACNQWRRQSQNAIQQMQRLYPPGWNR